MKLPSGSRMKEMRIQSTIMLPFLHRPDSLAEQGEFELTVPLNQPTSHCGRGPCERPGVLQD